MTKKHSRVTIVHKGDIVSYHMYGKKELLTYALVLESARKEREGDCEPGFSVLLLNNKRNYANETIKLYFNPRNLFLVSRAKNE